MREIFEAIETYARAYTALENLQRSRTTQLPRGDQKTGVIAEFYARLHAKVVFPGAELEYPNPSEPVSDILVKRRSRPILKIQVKAVSAHAEKGRVSPVHSGWDQLWLMRLDTNLFPEGFWVVEKREVDWAETTLDSSTMPQRGRPNTGSPIYRDLRDQLPALLKTLEDARSNEQPRETGIGPCASGPN